MNKKWMPITAGVLDVIHGAGGIFVGFVFIVLARGFGPHNMVNEITGFLLIVCGVLAIVGGVYAFRRKKWPLAFAGAIISLAPSIPYMYIYWPGFDLRYFLSLPTLQGFAGVPAIVAIILTVLSRKQFERK